MIAKKNLKQKPPLKQEIRKSPNFGSIYANWIQAQFSANELSLLIGEAFPTDGILEVEQKARIVIAPIQAKVLTAILAKVVMTYEKQNGKINIPEPTLLQLAKQIPEIRELIGLKTEGD